MKKNEDSMKQKIKSILGEMNIFLGSIEAQRRKDGLILEIDKLFDFMLTLNGGENSRSQFKQDVFALMVNKFKEDGYFVEFGATNGFDISNTYILEKQFGWRGVLVEPAKMWQENLIKNRDCNIEFDCVWHTSGELLDFDMVKEGELSTLSIFSNSDEHAKARQEKITYVVNTISLIDLLKKYNAPKEIDYLSVDTEGSELDILSAFDFNEYRFNCITIEHNFTENREKLKLLLEQNGYKRIFEHLSKWDDWYIAESLDNY
jgi:FkbM family methyltransferase